MKDSTKELFDRLQHSCLYEDESEIRKLKELCLKVEYYAQHGGFIKDSGGKICKTGDLVSVETLSYFLNCVIQDYLPLAKLVWNENKNCFDLQSIATGETIPLGRHNFYLIEEW